jgi:hypothetical protein
MKRSTLVSLTLLLVLQVGGASAQPAASVGSPYTHLSPGNQKMARALHEAQPAAPAGTRRLTLEDIAAQKQHGTGWNQVFRAMKSQGLIAEKTLAEVVTNYKNRHRLSVSGMPVRPTKD